MGWFRHKIFKAILFFFQEAFFFLIFHSNDVIFLSFSKLKLSSSFSYIEFYKIFFFQKDNGSSSSMCKFALLNNKYTKVGSNDGKEIKSDVISYSYFRFFYYMCRWPKWLAWTMIGQIFLYALYFLRAK